MVGGFWFWVLVGAENYHRWNVSETLVKRISFLELDQDLGWKGKPNFDSNWPLEEGTPPHWVRHYKNDANGFRDHTYNQAPERKQLDYRVWILGDSSPYGFGCAGDQTLAAFLRRHLFRRDVGVRNYCVTGYNTGQLSKLLSEQLQKGRPDLLVLWAGFNDVEFTKGMFYTSGPSKTVAFKRYQISLGSMLDLGLPTILVTLPHLEQSPDLDRINNFIREQDSRANVTVVDLNRVFEAEEAQTELYAPIDERLPMHFHPSERGHNLAFRALKKQIDERL